MATSTPKGKKLGAKTPEPTDAPKTEAVVGMIEMKKKDLIDLVVERSGVKRPEAKLVVEATLAVLGDAIGAGRMLNLPPMGKLRVNRTQDKPNGRVIVCKLRQNNGPSATPDDAPLAEPVE